MPHSAEGSARSALGRWVRRLGGGTDALSALNPQDRAIYTISGLVLLSTFLFSAVAMGLLTAVVLGLWWPVTIGVAALWGLMTSNLDRWLVENVPARGFRRRLMHALPAIALAFMVSLVTSEPLVLRIFRPAIEERLGGGSTGLLEQLVELDRLMQERPAVQVAVWITRLLFTVIVILPLLIRFLRRRTVQDDVLEYLADMTRSTRARSHLRLVERISSGKRVG